MPDQKLYILDTNVLIHDPNSPFSFAGVTVGIPAIVLEELDQFKSEMTDRGRNAREVVRRLDSLRIKGCLKNGVKLDNDSTIKILFLDSDYTTSMAPLSRDNGDNQILLTALSMKDKGHNVVFISKDINARVKADVVNLKAEDYSCGSVAEYDVYKGWRTYKVSSGQLKKDFPEELKEIEQEKLLINEFVLLESNHNNYNYRLFRYLGSNKFKPVFMPKLKWPLEAKNAQQLMALDLLMDENVPFISLVGPAGTGKSFLALLAGLDQVLTREIYEKILVSRPVIPLGADIGYLPGDIQEKLHSWMQPVYDNMDLIVHSAAIKRHLANKKEKNNLEYTPYNLNEDNIEHYNDYVSPEIDDEKITKRKQFLDSHSNSHNSNGNGNGKKNRNGKHHGSRQSRLRSLDDLINSGKFSLEAITYMRGRSIPYQYIFIDEAQNLTLHEVKTLVSRVGEGSKIILAGDPYQIDSPYLDFSSNGLTVASNKFKGQSIFGTVFLEVSERSELSRLATELL